MNSSNEHYKNGPFNKNGPPNWRICNALIEFLSGDIADLRDDPRDMHLRYLGATVTRAARAAIRSVRRQKPAEPIETGAKAKEVKGSGDAEIKEEAVTGDRPAKPGAHDEKLKVS